MGELAQSLFKILMLMNQFAKLLTVQPSFTWAVASGVGNINGSGVYGAGKVAGSAMVTATSGPVMGSAGVTVTNAAPRERRSKARTTSS